MKLPASTRLSMRVNLTLLVMLELLVIMGLVWLGLWLISYFRLPRVQIHDTIWLALLAVAIGSGVTAFLGRWIFAPITRLGRAMEQVAQGDFSQRLDEERQFQEIAGIYQNFNRMAQELGSTEILKTDFISNVSHEFKTPINAIEGYAMLLQGGEALTEQERQLYTEKILFNTRNLSALVGNILLLSRLDNQSISLEQSRYRLDEQIRQALLQLEQAWTDKELSLEVELEPILFTGPEKLLLQVWTNLIGNAVKFSPHGGELRVELKGQGERLLFTVSDRGPGIPPEAQGRIFEKFYQADSSHKQEGNGLGLALVSKIVRLLEGRVWAENREDGGCRFFVELARNINKS